MPVAMTDSAETEGSDGGWARREGQKKPSTSTFENKARLKLGEETKRDRTVGGGMCDQRRGAGNPAVAGPGGLYGGQCVTCRYVHGDIQLETRGVETITRRGDKGWFASASGER